MSQRTARQQETPNAHRWTLARRSTEVTKHELTAEVLQSYRELRLRVTGRSMLPAIWPGDILAIHPCGIADADLGDIVLFTRQGRLFAHRVVSRSGGYLVTQGDGDHAPDPPVKPGELIGRVFEIVRGRKTLRPKPKLSLCGRIAAALACRSASAGRILTWLHGLPGGAASSVRVANRAARQSLPIA